MIDLFQNEISSPIGNIYLISDGTNLRALDFEGYEARMHRLLERHYDQYAIHAGRDLAEIVSRLTSYFAGDLDAINQIAIAMNGTEFQHSVWNALISIPAGTTTTYSEIARRIGSPQACRAVGLANGSNPIAIIVPCHRVVGRNGHLTGYGGGIERKKWLLDHEQTFQKSFATDIKVYHDVKNSRSRDDLRATHVHE